MEGIPTVGAAGPVKSSGKSEYSEEAIYVAADDLSSASPL